MITRNRLLAMLVALALLFAALPMATFSANALENYVIDRSLKLALGSNALTLDANAITTIYEFKPSAAGIYRFTASEADALVGYWGAGTFFVFDQTENKTNTLDVELKNVGPSIMIGISGVSACTLTVENLGDSAIVVEPEWEQYENLHTPTAFTMPYYCDMLSVNVLNSKINQAVMGSDGFYHLDAADGPLLVVDFAHEDLSLQAAHSYGQVRRYYFDDAGNTVKKLDFYDALEAYMAAADGTKYPVTEDIKTMLVELGDYKGWYVKSEYGSYMFENSVVDPDEAWMFVCYYLKPCTLSAVAEKPATYEATGTKAHWVCQLCQTLFADAQGTQIVTASDLEIPVLVKEDIPLQITKQPASLEVLQGENAIFAVEALGEDLAYSWQYSINGVGWFTCSSFAGRNTAQMTVPATVARDGFYYRCKITDGNGESLITAAATLNIKAPETFKITEQPQDAGAAIGSSVAFTVVAEGQNLSYRWQYSKNGTSWSYSSATFVGYNTPSMTVPVTAVREGFSYRCVVTNEAGLQIISAPATLSIVEPITIRVQSASQSVALGEKAVFHVEAEGEGLTYYWLYSTNGIGWFKCTAFDGRSTDTMIVPATAVRDGFQYRCVITDAEGNVIKSDPAELIIID